MNKKMKAAIRKGDLIDFDKLFAGYSKKRQKQILEDAKHLETALAIRNLRSKLSLSQEKLAKRMKVKREFISKIESGQQNVTLETLHRIAEVTGKKFYFKFQ